jgi:apolipoprotein N-acyltransferase
VIVATGRAGSGAARASRLILAAVSGATLALTLPPFDLLPALAAWSGLLVLLLEADGRRASLQRALIGGSFGFGYHLAGLWWIGAAFLVDADVFGAFLPFAVIGLPLLLAPFTAAAAALVGLAPSGAGPRAIALAVAVSLTEWIRGVVLTGFPWNVAGEGLTASTLLSQGASAVGVAGLAVPAVLAGCLPVLVLRRAWRTAALSLALLAGLALYGWHRLATAPGTGDERPLVRIVQPSVPQSLKWDAAAAPTTWRRLLDLTAAPGAPDVVVWPETAFPFFYRTPGLAQFDLADALPDGATLLAGAAMEDDGRYTNSILAIDGAGVVVDRYDKVKLVPFGEFLPFAGLLGRIGLAALAANASTFSAGAAPAVFARPGLPPVQPLVCYEVIFAHLKPGPPADWIVNATNDAWFGDTPGPRQHLRLAELRAIERGVPVVRAANNGISAIIDSEGRTVARLPLDARGIIDHRLPRSRGSLYERTGDAPLAVLWAVSIAVILALAAGRSRSRGGNL